MTRNVVTALALLGALAAPVATASAQVLSCSHLGDGMAYNACIEMQKHNARNEAGLNNPDDAPPPRPVREPDPTPPEPPSPPDPPEPRTPPESGTGGKVSQSPISEVPNS